MERCYGGENPKLALGETAFLPPEPGLAQKRIKGKKNGYHVEAIRLASLLSRHNHINQHVHLPTAKPIHQRNVKKEYNLGLPVAERNSLKTIKKLGNGAFGQVYLVENKKHQRFALKLVGNDKELRHECAVMLKLSRSGPHKHLINVQAVSPGRNPEKYMLMELGGSSLYKDLKRGNMKDFELRDSFSQILNGASAIEKAGLQHNDLKPENILIDKKGDLKICDFGLADRDDKYAGGGTQVYMAPERLGITNSHRTDRGDSWALGCIFAEMRLGYPIMADLLPRNSSRPSKADLHNKLGHVYREILHKEGAQAANLFKQLTAIDPNHRITAQAALRHPYFMDFEITETLA